MTPRQPMRGLGSARPMAWLSTFAFATLAIPLAAIGSIPRAEALWAVAAVTLAFVPTGWWAGNGVRRRAVEASLVPAAFALTMIGGAAMRRMLLPPLLMLAAWAAVAAAWTRIPRGRRPLLAAFFGLSTRAAVGLGLTGFGGSAVAITFALAAVGPWAVARRHGRRAAELTALGLAAIPWQRSPLIGLGALTAFVVWGLIGDLHTRNDLVLRWLPGVAAAAFLGVAVGPWAGVPANVLIPAWGWPLAALIVAALILTPRLAPGVSGALWLLATLAVGQASPPPPDHQGFDLSGDLSRVVLPAGTGDSYVIDLAVEGGGGLDEEMPLAIFSFDGSDHPLRGRGEVAEDVIWRPRGLGEGASWGSAVRYRFAVPAGEQPVILRDPRIADNVELRVAVWGTERPTPPRDWALPQWLLAGAVAVALIQVLSGTWRQQVAILPWMFLVLGSLVARVSVEPLRLVGERLAVDIALVAVLAAWLPAARFWARRRRVFISVAALLVPLALATPHLTPSMYGDEPFHVLVMESLATDHDLDISDDLDLEKCPQNQLYAPGWPLFHSPALGVLLFPGYLIGGRTGALVLLALMGALLVALLARRARGLGLGNNLVALLVLLVAITYPVATFSTQIWPEVPGALAVAAILVLAAAGGRWSALFLAVGAVAVKTRLGLVAFPPALAAWFGRGRSAAVRGFLFLGIAAGASLAVGWLTMGHPLGPYRRIFHLIPDDPGLVLRVLGGLGFDPAGGLAFTAPLLLVALVGMAELWRRGGPGERALLVGCGLTLIALLHSPEWYAGGSPPARYLVPMAPAFVLAGGMVLLRPRRWRRLTELLLVPSAVAWWVLITRPHFSVNSGDGGYWLADALSRRFGADARSLFPSFLVPNVSTVAVPMVLLTVVFLAAWMAARIPGVGTALQRAGIALWLTAAATLVINLDLRYDRVVEVEAPQVRHRGGVPVPPAGTFSRYTYRRGWRLDNGDGVVVPLHLRERSEVWLECWFLGTVKRGGRLEVRWNDGEVVELRLQGDEPELRVLLPPPPGAGKHRLAIGLRCPPHRAVVLDRVVIDGG